MESELNAYIERCQTEMDNYELNTTAVTDHVARDKKYHTTSKKEDLDFYKYKKSVEEFNADVEYAAQPKQKLSFHLDSAISKILDPLLGMKKEASGAYFYEFNDSDLSQESEEKIKERFNKLVEDNNEVYNSEDDEDDGVGSKFFKDSYLEAKENAENYKRDIQEDLAVFKNG
jgi:hypothetical protein